jgi:hypothetical protein
MSSAAIVALWIATVVGVLGRVLAVVQITRLTSARWTLPVPGERERRDEVRVCCIVPARDEAVRIGRLLASLDAQDHANLEVIVVDDGSTDGTADIARRHRCTVITGAPLPAGWLGKPWALHQGVTASTGDILWFVDADTWHAPAAARAIALQLCEVDALVLVGAQELKSAAERLLPPFLWVMLLTLFSPERHEDPRFPDDAMGNGQCAAFTREAYLRGGGHEAVRDRVVEDLALARAVKRSGARSRFRVAPELTATRMYEGWASAWSGFSKNAAIVDPARKGLSTLLTVVSILLVLHAEVFPAVLLVARVSELLTAAAAVHLALVFASRFSLGRGLVIGGLPGWAIVAAPVGAVLGAVLMGWSLAIQLSGRTRWKGRAVRARSL